MVYNCRGLSKYELANTKEKYSKDYNKLINEAIEDFNKTIEIDDKSKKLFDLIIDRIVK